ncbi:MULTISPECIES: AAA family ATPase [Methanobacterium]|uniref:ATPase n=1 Tax=Methanobacterium bryantii TaxID=2161 RepID=A0A2A2H7X8_METBR|nr:MULTISPECIES: ATP-binding protein [Methanobacterium]OEC84356.1 ATPase [Methanobacterium sp. A39]PAV05512.1 ATPase [Methanobacterium bryantii]
MDDLAWGTDAELTDEQFYNREEDISLIKTLLESTSTGSAPTLMIAGIRGVGKTVLLKKIKKELENNYLICYADLSATSGYQMGNLTEMGIMIHFYECWMESCKNKGFSKILNKVKRQLTTKNFGIREFVDAGGYPIPIPKAEDDYKKLSKFVLELPQLIYEDHSDEIKGSILIIDEFQVLKDLGDRLNTFLWFLRSVIQSQKNVAYVFSGSVNSRDSITEQIAGKDGAFGGRMLNIEIHPFTKQTVQNYLNEKLPSLNLDDGGFERFYKCTNGIPFYVNTFAKLLPTDILLDENKVKKEFKRTLPLIAVHLSNQWNRLTLQEQNIITTIINGPIKRKDIANKLNITPGSLSKPLNKLQKLELIELNEVGYDIAEPILKAWLKKEYEEKGVFPFRSV